MKPFVLTLAFLSILSCKKDALDYYTPYLMANAAPRDGGVLLRFSLCNQSPINGLICDTAPNVRYDVYSCTPEGEVKDRIARQLAADSLVITGLNNNEVYHYKIQALMGRNVAGWSKTVSVMPGSYPSPEIISLRQPGSNEFRDYRAPSPDLGKIPFVGLDSFNNFRLMMEDRASGAIDTFLQSSYFSSLWSPDAQNMLTFYVNKQPRLLWHYERANNTVVRYDNVSGDLFSVQFSSDGQQVCFLKPGANTNTYDVCTMNVDGTNLQLGVSDIRADNIIPYYKGFPIQILYWDATQNFFYYNTYRVDSNNYYYTEKLLRMNGETRQTEEVMVWQGDEFISSISPNGRRIAFFSKRSGIPEIWLQDLETGDIQQLTSPNNGTLYLAEKTIVWSDNNHILVYGRTSESSVLCRFEVL